MQKSRGRSSVDLGGSPELSVVQAWPGSSLGLWTQTGRHLPIANMLVRMNWLWTQASADSAWN